MFQAKSAVATVVGFVVLAFVGADFGQGAQLPEPELDWEKAFSGIGYASGVSVFEDSDHNFVAIGNTGPTTGLNPGKVLIIKTNPSGTTILNSTVDSDKTPYVTSAQQTKDNGCIIAGYAHDTTWDYDKYYVYLLKADALGNKEWEKFFYYDNFDTKQLNAGYSVRQTSDNGYIIAGIHEAFNGEKSDVCLIKTNSSGIGEWEKQIGEASRAGGFSVMQAPDGGYVIAGRNNDGAYICKTDSLGNVAWENPYNEARIFNSVALAPDNGFVAAGEGANMVACLFRINETGNVLWNQKYEIANATYYATREAHQTMDGGFILTCGLDVNNLGRHVYLIKTDSLGNKEWSKTFNNSLDGYSAQQTKDNGYIVTGQAQSPEGYSTLYIAKLDAIGKRYQLKIFDHSPDKLIFVDTTPSNTQFKPEYGTAVLAHGWNTGCGNDINYERDPITHEIIDEGWILKLGKIISGKFNGKINILTWDWLEEAKARIPNCDKEPGDCEDCVYGTYDTSKELVIHRDHLPYEKIPTQANLLSVELDKLFRKAEYGADKQIHFIGHSLGAHVIAHCARYLADAHMNDNSILCPSQVTCMDPPAGNLFPSLEDICLPISFVRENVPGIYTELYDGISNDLYLGLGVGYSRKFHIFIDVPYEFGTHWGHDVYKWYIRTASGDYDVQILDKAKLNVNADAEMPGTLGFGTSCLLGENKKRPDVACEGNKESLNFNYLWNSDEMKFTYEGCLSYQCGITFATIHDNYFNSTPKFVITGEDDGSSFDVGALTLKAKSGGTAKGIFEFEKYPADSDFLTYEWMWYKEPGGGEAQPPHDAEFRVLVECEDKIFIAFESNTDLSKNNEPKTSSFIDMREFQGKRATVTFELSATDSSIAFFVFSITSYQSQGSINLPPQADAGDDVLATADEDGTALIQLSSTGSSDPENGELQYQWYEIVGENKIPLSIETHPAVRFSVGTHNIKLCVYDEFFAEGCDEVIVDIAAQTNLVRGDANGDGEVDISDVIAILSCLFLGDKCPDNICAMDVNSDGESDISDPIALLFFLFLGDPTPKPCR